MMTNPNQPASNDDNGLPGDGNAADGQLDSADVPQPIDQLARQPVAQGRQSFQASELKCIQCAYNLTGIPIGGSCPECGTPVDVSVVSTNQGAPSGKALASMLLGICALPGCLFYGIPAIVFGVPAIILGYSALDDVREGTVSLNARSQATTGIICGGIAAGLAIVVFIGIIIRDTLHSH